MDPGPVVSITLREIYEAVTRLTGRVDVLIEQHNAAVQDQREHERRADDRYNDHEKRLRSVERRLWPLPSLAAAVSLAALVMVIIPKL